MMSLAFGLTAACAWAVHDLLVRKIGQETAILPMMLVVLASGSAVLLGPSLIWGDWAVMGPAALWLSVASGVAYVLGMGGLYRAFSLAPVRLVAPIVGAFPMISLGLAALEGRPIAGTEVLAVVAIVGGIAVVALTGRSEGRIDRPLLAVLWAAGGAVGFATTFWLGQEAIRHGSELPVNLIARAVALILVAGLCLTVRAPVRRLGDAGRMLVLMGVLDAIALGLVTASARLPNPEYAAISSSLFGVLTILLAWRVLKETVLPLQWLGIVTVFAGIAALSSQA
jgi:drug/metabolite transporter (DMT)-like permease